MLWWISFSKLFHYRITTIWAWAWRWFVSRRALDEWRIWTCFWYWWHCLQGNVLFVQWCIYNCHKKSINIFPHPHNFLRKLPRSPLTFIIERHVKKTATSRRENKNPYLTFPSVLKATELRAQQSSSFGSESAHTLKFESIHALKDYIHDRSKWKEIDLYCYSCHAGNFWLKSW